MRLKRGLWLTLLDEAGEETPVASDIAERRPGVWRLEAMVPWQVYPVQFVAARLRLDGHFLGRMNFPSPIVTETHKPLEITLEFPVDEQRLAQIEELPENLRR